MENFPFLPQKLFSRNLELQLSIRMKNNQCVTSVYSSILNCILIFFFRRAHFQFFKLCDLEWQSDLWNLLLSVYPEPTHVIPPQLVLILYFAILHKTHRNEQLNPTDVSESPPMKPAEEKG